jgi:hypothetical protein
MIRYVRGWRGEGVKGAGVPHQRYPWRYWRGAGTWIPSQRHLWGYLEEPEGVRIVQLLVCVCVRVVVVK